MKRILIATDGSPGGDEAVEQGLTLAAATRAVATLVYVCKPLLPILGNGPYQCSATVSLARARHVMDQAAARAMEVGVKAECEILEGDAAERIVDLARLRSVDLIVVGSRALGWISGTLLGSVSRPVVAKADRPVLVVVARPSVDPGPVNKILVATDGSPSATEAVAFGIQLALEQGAQAAFVHVAPLYDVVPAQFLGMTGRLPHTPTASDGASLEEAAHLALRIGVPATTALLAGDPVDEIVAHADSIDADVIVIGSRGYGAVAGALLGSVSRGVLHEARRPVLVVREAAARLALAAAS